jgi:hypothetical protein
MRMSRTSARKEIRRAWHGRQGKGGKGGREEGVYRDGLVIARNRQDCIFDRIYWMGSLMRSIVFSFFI